MTVTEALMEKLKKLPLEKQEAALRFVEGLENPSEDRARKVEEFIADMRKGFLKGPIVPFNRDELYDRDVD